MKKIVRIARVLSGGRHKELIVSLFYNSPDEIDPWKYRVVVEGNGCRPDGAFKDSTGCNSYHKAVEYYLEGLGYANRYYGAEVIEEESFS